MMAIGRNWKWSAWPSLIIGLLSLQVVLCAIAVVLALRAPGGEVVPDYHRKAIEWDDRHVKGRAP